jgi:hypothetical protein
LLIKSLVTIGATFVFVGAEKTGSTDSRSDESVIGL